MARFKGPSGTAMWEMLNRCDTIEQLERKFKSFMDRATFEEFVDTYGSVQALMEAEAEAASTLGRLVFLPADQTREEWLANCSGYAKRSSDKSDA